MQLMKAATRAQPRMWGAAIVGFGSYHYKYESGREGDWFLAGFASRKKDITLYAMGGLKGQSELLKKLGRHTMGVGCLYIRALADVDTGVLQRLIEASVKAAKAGVAASQQGA